MKNYLVGFSIAVITALAIFFFYIVPQKERVKKELNAAFQKGYEECFEDIDTVFIPGEPEIIYRDTTIFVEKPTSVKSIDDSIKVFASSIDTSITLEENEIGIKATVGMEVNMNNPIETIAEWFLDVSHKAPECIPDTTIIKVPKLINIVETETNWLMVLIAFFTGNVIVLLASIF